MKLNTTPMPKSRVYRMGTRDTIAYDAANGYKPYVVEPEGPRNRRNLSFRRWERESLLNAVRTLITRGTYESVKLQCHVAHLVSIEEVSWLLRAKPGLVSWCFHRLNLEGILGHKVGGAPHDSRRDSFLNGRFREGGVRAGCSGWQASTFRIMARSVTPV